MPGTFFTIIRSFEIFLSIVAFAISGFVAGWATFSAGAAYSTVLSAYVWSAWFAVATAVFTLIAVISILANQRGTALSLGKSVAVLITDIVIFILLIVSVAGFANTFKVVFSTSTEKLSTGYSSDYYSDYYSDDYSNGYYPSYTKYYASDIEIAWYNCIKTDMAILAILFLLSLGAIIISSIEVHRLRIAPHMQSQEPYMAEPTMGNPHVYGGSVGPQPPQPTFAYRPNPSPMSPPPQQIHVYPNKLQ